MKVHVDFLNCSFKYDGLKTEFEQNCCLDLSLLKNWSVMIQMPSIQGYVKRYIKKHKELYDNFGWDYVFDGYGKFYFTVKSSCKCSEDDEYDKVKGERLCKTKAEKIAYNEALRIISSVFSRVHRETYGEIWYVINKLFDNIKKSKNHIIELVGEKKDE